LGKIFLLFTYGKTIIWTCHRLHPATAQRTAAGMQTLSGYTLYLLSVPDKRMPLLSLTLNTVQETKHLAGFCAHLGKGEPFFAQVFQRCTDMVEFRTVYDKETVAVPRLPLVYQIHCIPL